MPTYSILLFLLICHDKTLRRWSVLAEVKKDQLTQEKKQNETEDGIKMEMEKLMKKVNGFETKEGMNNSRSRKLPRETYWVKAEVDGTAALPCKFTMKSDINWKFQKTIIIEYLGGHVTHFHKRVEFIGNLKDGNASISIKDLHFNDSGEYKCEGTYISGRAFVDENVLVNLNVTGLPFVTTVPPTQECSSHIVAIAVLATLLVVGVAFAVFLYLFKRNGRFCWRENIENNTAKETIPMNGPSSNNGQNDGDDGGVQTSLASDILSTIM